MKTNNITRIFVKPDDTATLTCPHCQLAKTVAVGKFRSFRHTLTARCACGRSFSVNLDFRRSYRKQTSLPGIYETQSPECKNHHGKKTRLSGVYTIQQPSLGGGQMQVTNISCGGLQFTTPGKHHIEVGQRALINFTLDDRKQTKITKEVIIQSVTDNVIGCQFASKAPLEQGLRFYLFP